MALSQPLSVLIVEDEYFIADELARAVSDEGLGVVGPVSTIEQARALADSESIDHVLLDLNLGGESAVELARWFNERGTPVTVVSGYDKTELPSSLHELPFVQKPMSFSALLATIVRVNSDSQAEHRSAPSVRIG